jgi:hypothetical protein
VRNVRTFLFPELVPLAAPRARFGATPNNRNTRGTEQFPDLPGAVNDVLYRFGSASVALRSRWPTGTSLFIAATKLSDPPVSAPILKDRLQ